MKLLSKCSECGESKPFLTEIGSTLEIVYMCNDCYKKKYSDEKNVPRPDYWSGWNLVPSEIEFWLDGENRIHQRLKYIKDPKGDWEKNLLSP